VKAIKCTKYGPPEVLKIVNIEKPKPNDNQILIKNYSTTVTVGDCRVRGFKVPPSFWLPARLTLGIIKPKNDILGGEFSGKIEETGKNVKKYRIGDEIFAFTGHNFGAYAEYVLLDEKSCIAVKPENLTFEQSSALSFGGISSLHFIEKCNIKKNEKIVIYGASGSLGTYAVQLAKYYGANVTGICGTSNLEIIKQIGADNVIDYRKTDLSEIDEKFDIFFDTVGKADISKSIKLIKPNGHYIHAVTDPFTEMKIKKIIKNTEIKFIGGTYKPNIDYINKIRELAVNNKIRPVIDRVYNFDDIVLAHEYVDKGHKKGNVVIKIVE